MTLYDSYRQNTLRKRADGGLMGEDNMEKNEGFSNTVGMTAGLASGALDAVGTGDPTTGRPATGVTVAKGALKGAAMGAQFGPWGAVVGGVVGAAGGVLSANKQKKAARLAMWNQATQGKIQDDKRSQAMLASDPTLYQGYAGASSFANGGPIKPKAYNPNLAAGDKEFQRWYATNTVEGKHDIGFSDTEDYDYYSFYRNGEHKNYKGGHFPDTYKRTNHETFSDESIYSTPENPGGHWTGETYKRANGGSVEAPLAKMYMKGGQATNLSSDTVRFDGQTHEEGGIKIPEAGAEVEDGEVAKDNYVFSDKLGFAKRAEKLAKAKGLIEKKPVSPERMKSLELMNKKENELVLAQEYFKQHHKIA